MTLATKLFALAIMLGVSTSPGQTTLIVPVDTPASAPGLSPDDAAVQQAVGIFMKYAPVPQASAKEIAAMRLVDPGFALEERLKEIRATEGIKTFDIANARARGDAGIVMSNKFAGGEKNTFVFRLRKKDNRWLIVTAELMPADQARGQFEAFLRLSTESAATAPATWPATTAAAAPTEEAAMDPLVADLLIPSRRDAAARKLQARWDAAGAKMADNLGVPPVRNVVVCPQPKGPPLFLVFLTARANAVAHRTAGPAALIDAQGAFVRFEYFVPEEALVDVNNDGVLDRVQQNNMALGLNRPEANLTIIQITPYTREHKPVLRIACNPRQQLGGPPDPTRFSWDLHYSQSTHTHALIVGPRDETTGMIVEKASYAWNPKREAYEGPAGGKEKKILQLTRDDYRECYEFLGLDPDAKPVR